MKEIGEQFVSIFKEMNSAQKVVIVFIVVSMSMLLGYLLFPTNHYTPLFPHSTLHPSEWEEVIEFLEKKKIDFDEKKKVGVIVPKEMVEDLRRELLKEGIFKQDRTKGFELFDNSTWIKGEEELQVLEMRALKGQLEKDIAAFDNIKSANVILDLAPQRSFNSAPYTARASVILSLMPEAHLTASELSAISYHLAGAVRGLQPNMIAISDTSGKLYQAINPDGKGGFLLVDSVEEVLATKIGAILTKVVGKENFHLTTSHAGMSTHIGFSLLIDEHSQLQKEEIESQIQSLCQTYGLVPVIAVDFIPFHKPKMDVHPQKKKGFLKWILFMSMVPLLLPLLFFSNFFQRKKNEKEEENLVEKFRMVDLTKLAFLIQDESPDTISYMLSFLDKERAQDLLEQLPAHVREKITYGK